ncbi:MAG: Zn-ribbon containing protein [archaeon]
MSPHQCTKCGEIYPDAAQELLKGCNCGSRFFYYIKQEKLEQLQKEVKEVMQELEKADKDQIERDIRELTGLTDKPDEPVILDLESVKIIKPGKFEIDLVNLFNRNRPLIYKLEEGKYIIDLSSSFKGKKGYVSKKIRDPLDVEDEEESTDNTEPDEDSEPLSEITEDSSNLEDTKTEEPEEKKRELE